MNYGTNIVPFLQNINVRTGHSWGLPIPPQPNQHLEQNVGIRCKYSGKKKSNRSKQGCRNNVL